LNRLGRGEIETLPNGSHSDGGGLYLEVSNEGRGRSWVFRFTSPATGKVREMGLGRAGALGVPLKDARLKRDDLRRLLDQGHDPLEDRRRNREERAAKRTFHEVARAVIERKRPGWKGGEQSSSLGAWTRTLMDLAKPLHQRPVDEIAVADIKRVVAPKWDAGFHDEARLALGRIAEVFDYATAHGLRLGDNPAAWSVFKHIAPAAPKEARHHPALPWREAPVFVARLRGVTSMAALALEFLILTGVRLGEACGAEWDEMDLERSIWTIPAARMKRNEEHPVPLSDRAMAILKALDEHRGRSRFVFPGGRPGKPISDHAVKALCRRLSGGDSSVHGWRACFRSWMADHAVEFEVAESILAHSKAGLVAAYQRSPMTERKRPVYAAWASWLDGAEVIDLATRRA
jgi:integrase